MKYVWGLDLLYETDYSGQVSSVAHADALSSVRSLTNANGNVIQTYQRDAYGRRTSTTGGSGQPFDFTGEFRDQNTGFLFLRSRMYDPQIGRFLSRDSFSGAASQPASLNQFSYVHNNPATLRDPSGKCPFCLLPVAIYLGVELGLFGFDTIDTAQTLMDPTATDVDKAATVTGFTAGAFLPGGGFGVVGRTGAQAFKSFSAFKRAMGSAGPDAHWHHIVGQTDANISRFGAQKIHSTDNVIALDAAAHHRISGYYNSIQEFTDGKRVREWLAGQSYEYQREFGLETVRRMSGSQ
jgi:RHS repeat-associated protein